MKLSHGSARGVGALMGVITFVVAMNVYVFAPLLHSFRTAWVPCVAAWVVYRLAWARLSVLRRCPGGCGARIYYRLEACPHCLTPVRRPREKTAGPEALHHELRAVTAAHGAGLREQPDSWTT